MSNLISSKILFILGPTATGKTALALKLAKQFGGDIVSADSRQVYKGLNLVTGKDIPKGFAWKKDRYTNGTISLYGLDLVKPDQEWNVSLFQKYAHKTIKVITSKGRLPIIVGGTGLYIDSLITDFISPTKPDPKLRKNLESLSLTALQSKLNNLNPVKFISMNHSDQNNPRRLIRAIEIASSIATPHIQKKESLNNHLIIGLTAPLSVLEKKISTRVRARLKMALGSELNYLNSFNLNKKSPASSSLGYQELDDFFNSKINEGELTTLWSTHERQYAKRQLTWFKKRPNIIWFDISHQYFKKVVDKLKAWYSHS